MPVEYQRDLGNFVFFIGQCAVEDQRDLGKFLFFNGYVWKIYVTLEIFRFSCVIFPVEDQCDVGKFVFFMGLWPSGRSM